MDENAAWTVSDVLSGVTAPSTSRPLGIAYKTGTSYGYRDAWSVGYNGRYVLGVWVGRPDNAAVPGISGYATAAPILFKAFERSGLSGVPLATRPSAARRIPLAELPQSLKRFSLDADGLTSVSTREKPPQIIYPPEGAQIELGASADGTPVPLALKLQAGRPPFRWLANGKPLDRSVRTRTSQWLPEGAGYSTLTVIDAAGRAASVGVFLH
jgi:penicillin-binding protein 1C